MSVVVQLLRNARALIADPEHWTKGAYARTAEGSVAYTQPTVVYTRLEEKDDFEEERIPCKWCALGAVYASTYWPNFILEHAEKAKRFLNTASDEQRGVIAYNDDPRTTHAGVLAMYDRAIVLAERDELVGV